MRRHHCLISCRVVQSRDVHPCCMVSRCQRSPTNTANRRKTMTANWHCMTWHVQSRPHIHFFLFNKIFYPNWWMCYVTKHNITDFVALSVFEFCHNIHWLAFHILAAFSIRVMQCITLECSRLLNIAQSCRCIFTKPFTITVSVIDRQYVKMWRIFLNRRHFN